MDADIGYSSIYIYRNYSDKWKVKVQS